ncbi:MAG: fructose-6-phosphate aldolase [Methanomassiliicoccales archaeon]|nr:MAG: fructose-6-phosphate aldolase [Methanomassiliicoccales archaeon]
MKIFLDTANVEHIKEASSWGIIDGVTTNPTLIAREGRNFEDVVKEICSIVDGPISAEVVSMKSDEMVEEAKGLAQIHKNIVIKVPIMPEGLKTMKRLKELDIKTNATLIFSPNQALLAAKVGATYVSPFIGRLDDIGHIGMDIIRDIMIIFENYKFESEVIVASIRNPIHVIDAAIAGAHIATVPYDTLRKMVKHSLTDVGIERFLSDWEKVPKVK